MERIETDALRDLAGSEVPLTLRIRAAGSLAGSSSTPVAPRGPVSVVWPDSVEAASRLVAYAHARKARVLAIGGGSFLRFRHDDLDPSEIEIEDLSATPERAELGRTIGAVIAATGVAPDLVVSTKRLVRVLEHSPADLVARAECGLSFSALQDHLSRRGQRVPLDPAFPFAAAESLGETDSTVGGVLATNAFGPRRLRSGTARDWVLGTRLIRFDGAVVQSGGRVVKNVSGYDLNKLYLGAMGAFGILVDAFFKLEPIPHTRGVLTAARAPSDERGRSVALVRQWLDEPWPLVSTLFARDANRPSSLSASFEGLPETVAARGERLLDLARTAGFLDVSWQCTPPVSPINRVAQDSPLDRVISHLPSSDLSVPHAPSLGLLTTEDPALDRKTADVPPLGVAASRSSSDQREPLDGSLIIRLHHLPAEHLEFDRLAWDVAPEAWSGAIERTLLGAGISWLYWPAAVMRARPEAAWREDLVHLRRAAVSLGGHLVIERAPRGWLADLPRLDVPGDPRRMMARLLRSLDPSDTFLPGMYPHELRSAPV